MPHIAVVNASPVLEDSVVAPTVPVIAKFDTEILVPEIGLETATYEFIGRGGPIPTPSDGVWPIFLNNHSTDPGALGWHDDATDQIFSRVFVGDCQRYGVDWLVDLTHEAWEMRGDPTINKTVTLPDGRVAAYELCDPVEDDLYGIPYENYKLSDFVLPAYWGAASPGAVYDYGRHLQGPCPTLMSGGYQSLIVNGQWTQINARRKDGAFSWRAQRQGRGFRRSRR